MYTEYASCAYYSESLRALETRKLGNLSEKTFGRVSASRIGEICEY